MYDLIGDIHGHATELKSLLKKMDYRERNGAWQHPERKAIFVGDYIDRGPEIRETLQIVRAMTAAGAAHAIMGNHEYNALAFHYHRPEGGHIRRHTIRNLLQHYETIKQFKGFEKEWDDHLSWFANLPLFLELDGLRVVHACWDTNGIEYLKNCQGPLTREVLLEAHRKGSEAWQAFETVLKGKEHELPDGHFFVDKDGHARSQCRLKWWLKPEGMSMYDYFFHAPASVKGYPLPEAIREESYPLDAPPVFFGHYWLEPGPGPALLSSNCCCLDYSVAKKGNLVGYRFEKGEVLSNAGFVHVQALG